MSPVTAPADRRFRRAHVKPGRRRRWYAALFPVGRYVLLTVVILLGVYYSATAITHASALAIDDIAVTGNQRLPTHEIIGLLTGLKGQNLIVSDLDEFRARLVGSPWIKEATLKRAFPSSVKVTVRERVPIGLGRIDGRLYLVDERGAIIDQYRPAYAEFDLPIIDGLKVDGLGGDALKSGGVRNDGLHGNAGHTGHNDARAALAAQVLMAVRSAPELARLVSQIDVSDEHNAAVILDGDPALVYVGTDRFVPRLQAYLELAAAMRERVNNIDYVDLRFDDHIYVRPSGRTGTVEVLAGSSAPPTLAPPAPVVPPLSRPGATAAPRPPKKRSTR
jgi:cell division septal protein FtsQ